MLSLNKLNEMNIVSLRLVQKLRKYWKHFNLREKWQDPQKYPPQQPIFWNVFDYKNDWKYWKVWKKHNPRMTSNK